MGSITEIAVAYSIPREFLAKILKDLTNGGLPTSHLGVNGGYCLVESSNKISLWDVIEAPDGPVQLNSWIEASGKCCSQSMHCPMRQFWISQERTIKASLSKRKLSNHAD